jgi:hypothetical protein
MFPEVEEVMGKNKPFDPELRGQYALRTLGSRVRRDTKEVPRRSTAGPPPKLYWLMGITI